MSAKVPAVVDRCQEPEKKVKAAVYLADNPGSGMDGYLDKRMDWRALPAPGAVDDGFLSGMMIGELAIDVLEVLFRAVAVPVAFTEGFLRAYLSVNRVVEGEDGSITIVPHASADLAEVISDADEILARVDGNAVFNPVVRSSLPAAHQVSRAAMEWDVDAISTMDDDQLMGVLRAMQAASERERLSNPAEREAASDQLRARLAAIRLSMQGFVDRREAVQDSRL